MRGFRQLCVLLAAAVLLTGWWGAEEKSSAGRAVRVVGFRSPAVDSLSRTFTIKIDLPQEFHFVSGQLCRLDIILSKVEGYGVPNSASRSGGGRSRDRVSSRSA